jgi:hypothetical protein
MHGSETVPDPENRCELLPDGARIDQWGMHDPPADPGALLRAKRRFVELKLQVEENAFNTFHRECGEQLSIRQRYGNTVPPPPADWREQLQRGKGRIRKLRVELGKLDREIAALPDEQARRAFHEQRQQQSSDARQALTELMTLRADD